MKKIIFLMTILSILMTSLPAMSSMRTRKMLKEDTTERLENIKELKKNIRSLKVRLKNFETAIIEAKKKPNRKAMYVYTKKFAEVVTTVTLLVVTVSAYRNAEMGTTKLVKPGSIVASVSSAISGISGVLSDLSNNDLELLNGKVKELSLELSATETNLNEETYLLCSQEPSNQMCLNFVQK